MGRTLGSRDQDYDLIAALWSRGLTRAQVAECVGCTTRTVSRALSSRGLYGRTRPSERQRALSDAARDRLPEADAMMRNFGSQRPDISTRRGTIHREGAMPVTNEPTMPTAHDRAASNLNDAGDIDARYRDLACAIVAKAVSDMRAQMRASMRRGKGPRSPIESWFRTEWADLLCSALNVDATSVPDVVRAQEAAAFDAGCAS